MLRADGGHDGGVLARYRPGTTVLFVSPTTCVRVCARVAVCKTVYVLGVSAVYNHTSIAWIVGRLC